MTPKELCQAIVDGKYEGAIIANSLREDAKAALDGLKK